MLSRSSSSLIFSSLALGAAEGILDAGDLAVAPVLKRFRRGGVVAVYVDDHQFYPCRARRGSGRARSIGGPMSGPDRGGHHRLAAHQQPRGAQQRGAGHALRVGRIDLDLDAEFAGRMFDRDGLHILTRHHRDALRGRAVEHAGGGNGHRRQHADGVVADMRDEAARADGAPGARGSDQRHLRVILARHVAKLHRVAAGDAQPLDPRLQLGIGVQLIDALIAGAADIGGLEDHQRHAVVDAGHGDAVDHVADIAGRQQSRRDRARGIEEVDLDRRRRARRAVDAGAALIFDMAVRGLHGDVALHVGVQRQHPQRGGVAARLDEAGLERERHHRGEHVAAVGRGVDGVLVRLQLREQEIEIDPGPGAPGRRCRPCW